MSRVKQLVQSIQIRIWTQQIWESVSSGALFGGLVGCGLALARVLTGVAFSPLWIVAVLIASPLCSLLWSAVRWPSSQTAARSIDERCDLKDRVQTAFQFLQVRNPEPMQRLQVAEAEQCLASLQPSQVIAVERPSQWAAALLSTVSALLLSTLALQSQQAEAAIVLNERLVEQAQSASEQLEELENFQKEQPDNDLDQMLKEMNRELSDLQKPGMEPKEALAKLSSMEAELQAMQQKLAVGETEKQLQEVGNALSLEKSLESAGEALTKGDLKKAAEELKAAQLPEMDRKTTTAVAEKLEEVQKKSSSEAPQSKTEQAAKKMAEAVRNKDAQAFQDSAQDLAAEAARQASKKQLSDLLKKQNQSLAECKAAVESESEGLAKGNRKGGTKAGKGSGGDPRGEKSAANAGAREMRLTGQDTRQGDSDKQTETTTEKQEQHALREYQKQSGKFEALNESVLETEAIPSGQKQTIRRYFELIRPQNGELTETNIAEPNAP